MDGNFIFLSLHFTPNCPEFFSCTKADLGLLYLFLSFIVFWYDDIFSKRLGKNVCFSAMERWFLFVLDLTLRTWRSWQSCHSYTSQRLLGFSAAACASCWSFSSCLLVQLQQDISNIVLIMIITQMLLVSRQHAENCPFNPSPFIYLLPHTLPF